jgi:thiol-disulfide isomerase/thioredoxin
MRALAFSIAALLALSAPSNASLLREGETTTIPFTLSVANLDWEHSPLRTAGPATGAPAARGAIWYGAVNRTSHQAVIEGKESGRIVFAADYVGAIPIRGWCDANENGDLSDDAPVMLKDFPSTAGARSFVVRLSWRQPVHGVLPSPREVRVVLEPEVDGSRPAYRVQVIRARVAVWELEGIKRKAFLYDGNWDGVYTRDFGDGMYLDADGDGLVHVDPMDEDFSSFGRPFHVGDGVYEVTDVDLSGERITVRRIGTGPPPRRAAIGKAAPEVAFEDSLGHPYKVSAYRGRYLILYFWASWCATCAYQAPQLRDLQTRRGAERLAILGVSFDTDMPAALEFRRRLGSTWPTSLEGRMEFENTAGWTYRAAGAGLMYLIDPSGTLVGRYSEVATLERELAAMSP